MNTTNQKGSIIIYALLTMSVMLAAGLTLTELFVSKLRLAVQARNTMVALYAADSATELCLYEARQLVDEQPLTFGEGATYRIADMGGVDVTADCTALGSASFGFRATGLFRGVSRTLEITQ